MYEFLDFQTHDVMTREPLTVGPETPIGDAQALFEKHDVDAFPVVGEAGALLGVVSKLDVLRAFVFTDEHMFPPYEEILRRPVSSVMSRDVRSVTPRTPLTRVLQKLVDIRCKSMPVLSDERLVGIIAREDVLQGLRRAAEGERPRSSWEGPEPAPGSS